MKFYFDYKSPYSYLAIQPLHELEERLQIHFEWLPYNTPLADIFGALDTRTQLQWNKVKNLYIDVRRFANERGLIIKGTKKIYDSTLAILGALYAQKQNCFHDYNNDVFEMFWKHELELDVKEDILSVLEKYCDTENFSNFCETKGALRIHEINKLAEQDGVYGVPSFVVDDELFFGHDRLNWVEKKFKK
jgi:2-hydroxychromene-2-carboxylate isomerase